MKLIGLDFSINKPAACIYKDGNYQFLSWPFGLSERLKNIFKEAGVAIFDRDDQKYKGSDSSEKMRWEVANAIYISDKIITDVLNSEDYKEFHIVFEGISYASTGNVALQLGGYKYLLMKAFWDEEIPFKNMTTYAPITLKKTAGASKKGMGKKEMINSFLERNDNYLAKEINKDPSVFQKKTGNWIDHLDDLVDAYWAVHTYLDKN